MSELDLYKPVSNRDAAAMHGVYNMLTHKQTVGELAPYGSTERAFCEAFEEAFALSQEIIQTAVAALDG